MDRLILLQFCLLLLAVPLQYFMLTNWSSKDIEQSRIINRIKSQTNVIRHYLSPNTWFNWLLSFFIKIPRGCHSRIFKRTWRRDNESPALEVYSERETHGYFATSPNIRSPRPQHVQFRIGQVIRHKIDGYRAVIIGWDEKAQAPRKWLNEHPEYIAQPNYSVLIDSRDHRAYKTYIPQEHIEVLTNTKIFNVQLSDYFNSFDGNQYVMQPWIKEQYPQD